MTHKISKVLDFAEVFDNFPSYIYYISQESENLIYILESVRSVLKTKSLWSSSLDRRVERRGVSS